ncbi:MAG: MFS transporter [Pseudomonadota bacterium]
MPNISPLHAILVCALLVIGTVIGLAGIDLVLPAIPDLPAVLGGNASIAQFVIAAYSAGTIIGVLTFGALSDRFDRRHLMIIGVGSFALISLACANAQNIFVLIGLRFLQGIVATAPVVFAPGMIRALFSEQGAIRAMGVLSSIESLAPALAPIAGLWLLLQFGWQASFLVTALLAAGLAVVFLFDQTLPPVATTQRKAGSYLLLLRNATFLRYALSQAFALGGVLVFVFGAPVVIVNSMSGELTDFIAIQIAGISSFILATNTTGFLAERFGAERMIYIGAGLAVLGTVLLFSYAMIGGNNPAVLIFLFIPLNFGFGLRGPLGFYRGLVAANGDDDRASSLIILSVTMVVTIGTALFAPFIDFGLPALTFAALLIEVIAIALLIFLPPLQE